VIGTPDAGSQNRGGVENTMCSRPTALVIGAGLGGIAAAARLARNGYNVTVLEKNSQPGGRCGQIIRDGHRFDLGATLLLMPEVFAQTYADRGERLEDHLDLRRIDPTYRVHFDDGTTLALTSDLNALQTQLEAIEPGSFGGLLRYLWTKAASITAWPWTVPSGATSAMPGTTSIRGT
jgi:phytoene dehydrogenase-like protein